MFGNGKWSRGAREEREGGGDINGLESEMRDERGGGEGNKALESEIREGGGQVGTRDASGETLEGRWVEIF